MPERSSSCRRTRSLVVTLAVGLALLSACGGDPVSKSGAATGEPGRDEDASAATGDGTPVLVLGDSLTVGAKLWGHLGDELAGEGWKPTIKAKDGQSVEWGIEQVEALDEVPPVVVVGLGTNPGATEERFPDRVTELVDALTARGATTVLWWAPPDAGDHDRADRAAALEAAAGDPLVVPDWPSDLADHPRWITDDGIHYTPDGYAGLAAFIARALSPYAEG